MTLTDFELSLRQDLNDLDASQYRWPGSVLERCIARAVREYSFVAPRLLGFVMRGSPGLRAYPLPRPSGLAAPAAPGLMPTLAGGLPMGTIYVRVTACTQASETAPSPPASQAVGAGQALSLDLAPAPGAAWYGIYAGLAPGGETWNGFAGQPGAGAYTLTSLAPTSRAARAVPPAGTAQPLLLSQPAASAAAWWLESLEFPVGGWPPSYLPFEEQGGIFILNVRPERLPAAADQVMNLVYAAAHQLDVSGSTLPEQDQDVIALGALGYACLQYGVAANDNFRYQDGDLRDHVDDTGIPVQWRTTGEQALERFRARLADIARRRDLGAAAVVRWGDVPRAWQRL